MEESTSSSSDYLDEDYARRPQVPQTHTNWNSWHGSERASLEWMAQKGPVGSGWLRTGQSGVDGSERASLEWMAQNGPVGSGWLRTGQSGVEASGYEWCYALLVVQARNDEMMTTTMYLETQDVEYKCIAFTESRCKHCVMMDVW